MVEIKTLIDEEKLNVYLQLMAVQLQTMLNAESFVDFMSDFLRAINDIDINSRSTEKNNKYLYPVKLNLKEVTDKISEYSFEYLFINDGCLRSTRCLPAAGCHRGSSRGRGCCNRDCCRG